VKPQTEEVIILDEFETAALPSLEDLMQEFAAEEAESPGSNDAVIGGIRVVAEIGESFAESEEPAAHGASSSGAGFVSLQRDNMELNAALRRVQSDFENYRRRVERERSEHYGFALTAVVKELLPVLDNFRIALKNAAQMTHENDSGENQDGGGGTNSSIKDFFDGFELILHQLERVLSAMGVQQIAAKGEIFNPQFHEAVSVEPDDKVEPNTIIEELVRGYRLGNKLIRPALVKVSTQT
jgi:molecular chaperone GrpE